MCVNNLVGPRVPDNNPWESFGSPSFINALKNVKVIDEGGGVQIAGPQSANVSFKIATAFKVPDPRK